MIKYKTLDDFWKGTPPEKLLQAQKVREIIFSAVPELSENLKWNAPNYVFHGEDRITFNLMNKEGKVKLILHMGATRKEDKKGAPVMEDPYGIVKWNSDIRGMIVLQSLEHISSIKDELREIVKRWVEVE